MGASMEQADVFGSVERRVEDVRYLFVSVMSV